MTKNSKSQGKTNEKLALFPFFFSDVLNDFQYFFLFENEKISARFARVLPCFVILCIILLSWTVIWKLVGMFPLKVLRN